MYTGDLFTPTIEALKKLDYPLIFIILFAITFIFIYISFNKLKYLFKMLINRENTVAKYVYFFLNLLVLGIYLVLTYIVGTILYEFLVMV